jgi:hypothetical protein
MWISNAATATLGVVFARDPQDGLSIFLVPTSSPGFHVGGRIEIMGLRGTELNELDFDKVIVPDENRLGSKTGVKPSAVLRKVLPDMLVYRLGRTRNIALTAGMFKLSRSRPKAVRRLLLATGRPACAQTGRGLVTLGTIPDDLDAPLVGSSLRVRSRGTTCKFPGLGRSRLRFAREILAFGWKSSVARKKVDEKNRLGRALGCPNLGPSV